MSARYAAFLIAPRRAHPVFRRRRFRTGVEAGEPRWYTPADVAAGGEVAAGDRITVRSRSIVVLRGSAATR